MADKKNMRLLLFAEMKLPGEAWLEFKIVKDSIFQTATFRPKGIMGKNLLVLAKPIPLLYFQRNVKESFREKIISC